MTLAAAGILFVLALTARFVGRTWLFPPALWAAYWAAILVASTLVTFGDHRLSASALAVFVAGALAFFLGGTVVFAALGGTARPPHVGAVRKRFMQSCILWYSLGLLALAPVFARRIQSIRPALGVDSFAQAARTGLGAPDRAGIPQYFQSAASVGAVLALLAAWLFDGTRRDRVVLAVGVAAPLLMGMMTLSRSPLYALVAGVLGILVFRRTVRPLTIAAGLALAATAALAMGAMLGKTSVEGFSSLPGAVVESLSIYFVGGPVGFSDVLSAPEAVGDHGLSLRFFTQAATWILPGIDLPDNVLGYSSPFFGNVYTFYYAYWLDGGWWGVLGVSFLAGALCTALYSWASRGITVAGVGLGVAVASILNSATGDGLFASSVPWILLLGLAGGLSIVPIPAGKTKKPGALTQSV